ncbi:MAG: helix-turn-helix domain-containing protein [Ruminococcus sp.]|jgi:AraC-like DNA-binding protein
MKTNEKGVYPESEVFFLTPSKMARKILYYITRGGHYICSEQYSFSGSTESGRHPARQNMLLMYVKKGSMLLTLDGRQYQAGENQIVFVDCLRPHEYRTEKLSEFYWLHLEGANSRAFCESIIEEHGQVFPAVQSSSFLKKFRDIIDSCRPTVGTGEISRAPMIYQLLCMAYHPQVWISEEEKGEEQEGDEPINRAVSYIAKHLDEKLDVPKLAEMAGMSISHFSRQFKGATTYSPHEYLVLKRIDYAQGLLYGTNLSVSEIAEKTGYSSETNFIVSFKKKMGISPSRFRKLTQPQRDFSL